MLTRFRPTYAVIDLKALKNNVQEVRKHIPKNCKVLAMVKADAYGHGVIPIAQALVQNGVHAFGVATVEEGIELREAKIQKPILIMGGMMGQGEVAARAIFQHKLTPVVHSTGALEVLEKQGKKLKAKLEVHVKIDTGMSRLGLTPQALPYFLTQLKKIEYVKLKGVMTHLAFHQDEKYRRYQSDLFKNLSEKIKAEVGKVAVWHIANSAAVMEKNPICFNGGGECWVRPGIMLYGIPPYPEYQKKAKLNPVMSLNSQVALIKHLPKGTNVSYNCTFTTKRRTCIGLVPIGYADGYPWALSNKAHVLVEGKRAKVLGRVTMDMILIDVTDISSACVGSEVVLMGRQGREEISADLLAKWAGTIPYEIVCGISKRMPRVYI